jgi:hypothetical protein
LIRAATKKLRELFVAFAAMGTATALRCVRGIQLPALLNCHGLIARTWILELRPEGVTRHPIFEAKGAGLQVKKVSLFQIRQHCSSDKGQADIPQ